MNEPTPIQGTVAVGWEPVRDAFAANFVYTEEVGAGVAAYHRGVKVVDLLGGSVVANNEELAKNEKVVGEALQYNDDTLQLVFSTTKGITAIALGMCVDRGLIEYGAPVSKYWPEFASNDKGDATVAELISHQCGLYTVDGQISLAEALDWDTVTTRLAQSAPRWPIGAAHGYHALTYGWLAGELVRRVDPQQRSLGRFVQDEIVRPLDAELWIGLPEDQEPRVAPMIAAPPPTDPVSLAMAAMIIGPGTRGGDALSLNGVFSDGSLGGVLDTTLFNSRDVHAAEIPAANAITNARSLAKIYAATLSSVEGVQLLSDATRDVARTTLTPAGEADMCLIMETTFGMGFMTYGPVTPFSGPGSFGHFGAGGSVAYAQPERDLAFAYVMNRMANNMAGDLRAQALIDAAAACADAAG